MRFMRDEFDWAGIKRLIRGNYDKRKLRYQEGCSVSVEVGA